MSLFDDIPIASGRAAPGAADPTSAAGVFDDLPMASSASSGASTVRGPTSAGRSQGERRSDAMELFGRIGTGIAEVARGVPEGAASAIGTGIEGVAGRLETAVEPRRMALLGDFQRAADMPPEELNALRRRIDETADANDRSSLQGILSDVLDGSILPEELPAALGVNAPEMRDFGQRVSGVFDDVAALRPAPGWGDSIPRQVGQALGSTVPIIASSAAFGPAGGAALGMTMAAGEADRRAREGGATDEQRRAASLWATVPGLSEIIPVQRFLRIPGAVEGLDRVAKEIGESALIEGLQEASAGFMQNLIERGLYNPDQGLVDNVPEEGAIGGAVGAIIETARQGALGALGRRGGRRGATDGADDATAAPDAQPSPAPAEPPADIFEDIPVAQPQPQAPPAPRPEQSRAPAETPAARPIAPEAVPGDRERASSPRLTPEDRASPTPNDLIDDGKAMEEMLLNGTAPPPPAPDQPAAIVPDQPVSVRFPDGERFTGRVRARTDTQTEVVSDDGEVFIIETGEAEITPRASQVARERAAPAQPPMQASGQGTARSEPAATETAQAAQGEPVRLERGQSITLSPTSPERQRVPDLPADAPRVDVTRPARAPQPAAAPEAAPAPVATPAPAAPQRTPAPPPASSVPTPAAPPRRAQPRAADYERAWNGLAPEERASLLAGVEGLPKNADRRKWNLIPKSARPAVQARLRPSIVEDRATGEWWSGLSSEERSQAASRAGLSAASAQGAWDVLSRRERAALAAQRPQAGAAPAVEPATDPAPTSVAPPAPEADTAPASDAAPATPLAGLRRAQDDFMRVRDRVFSGENVPVAETRRADDARTAAQERLRESLGIPAFEQVDNEAERAEFEARGTTRRGEFGELTNIIMRDLPDARNAGDSAEATRLEARARQLEASLSAPPEPAAPAPEPAAAAPRERRSTTERTFGQGRPTIREEQFTETEAESLRPVIDALRARLDELGLRDVALRLVARMQSVIDGQASTVDGVYVRRMMTLALDGLQDGRTLNHEAIHAMKELGLFSQTEWALLSARAERDWMARYDIANRYADYDRPAQIEEAIAEAYADWVGGNLDAPSMMGRMMQRVRDVLEALRNALNGAGFRTASDVFGEIEAGRVGARDRNPGGMSPEPGMASEPDAAPEDMPRFARSAEDLAARADRATRGEADILPEELAARIRGADRQFIKDMGLFAKLAVYPRTLAAMSRTFAPVYRAAVEQFQRRDAMIADLSERAQPYMDLSNEGKANVNKVLEIGRLAGRDYRPGPDGTIEVVNDVRDTELSARGEVIRLSPEEVSAYRSVRITMSRALEMFKGQVMTEFGLDPEQTPTSKSILDAIPEDARDSQRESMQTVARLVREIEQAERTGYVPFTRYGNVVVTVRKPLDIEEMDPISGGNFMYRTVWSKTVEVDGLSGRIGRMTAKGKIGEIPAVKAALDEAKALYGRDASAEINVFQSGKEGMMQAAGLSAGDVDLLSQVARFDPNEQQRLLDAYDRIQKERGFRKHFFGSRNVPGYSVDFERSIADYITGIGGYLARRQTNGQWEQAIEGIPGQKPRERKYADTYRDYVNNPVEELATLRQAAFVYFIAGNVSTAALNLTQVPLFTAPYMTMFANPLRVSGALTRGYKDAAAMMSRRAGMDIFDPSKAPADVRDEVQKAWDEGMFVPLVTYEMMGAAHNRGQALRGLSKKVRKAIDVVALTYSFAERTNRVATYVAALRLVKNDPEGTRQKAQEALRGSGLAREELLNNFTPERFAEWVVDETHFKLGKVNRSSVMRGPGAALLQFKSFPLNALELQYRMARMYGKPGKQALALQILALVATAGVWAIPFAEDGGDLFEAIYKWWTQIDIDTRTEVREMIAEMTQSKVAAELISRGGLRATGLDMSRRIGMGELIPNTTEEAAGVPFSLTFGKAMQTADFLKRGDYLMAIGETMPNFIRNPIHAFAWGQDGIRSQSTGQMLIPAEDLSGSDVAAKALGFTSSRVANTREGDWSARRSDRAIDDLRRTYYSRISRAAVRMSQAETAGDSETADQAREEMMATYAEIGAHNAKAVEEARYDRIIDIQQRTVRQRMMQELEGMSARDGRGRRLGRERRGDVRDLYDPWN